MTLKGNEKTAKEILAQLGQLMLQDDESSALIVLERWRRDTMETVRELCAIELDLCRVGCYGLDRNTHCEQHAVTIRGLKL